ncbi:hypothetical protein JOC86_003101 [Bacillus pakistanensis]|uniref:Sporulation protein n=1 Tax=Rossellomorea pakistanensis TaxID=992288 RepID=A0ABS2NFK4_9BACI|nr:DUF1360 domain-containing protein [Bacillus pakistanensis]MBM7586549.1 hypothetical protein [Bacillus pakistanensis]
MELTIFQFLVICLASFRLTHLIVFDKITEFLRAPFFEELREKAENGEEEVYLIPKSGGITGFIGDLLSCYWCTGVWSATGLYLLFIFFPIVAGPIITILAVAGMAAVIEVVVQKLF